MTESKTSIRVILAEDHLILRDGIKALLKEYPEITVVGEASNGKEVEQVLAEKEADVLIADLSMPGMDGIATTRYVAEKYQDVKVLMLSTLDNEESISKCFQAGAYGYVLKSTGKDELVNAIRIVSRGEPYISHKISLKMIKRLCSVSDYQIPNTLDLSTREVEVLGLIAEGYTNIEIAEKTFTSKRTIETHRRNLIEKTCTKNTATLIRFAVKNGLLK